MISAYPRYSRPMQPSFVMVDDFLNNPDELRRHALALTYDPSDQHGNFPGRTSGQALPIAGLDDYASRVAGMPLKAAVGTVHGHCRLTLKSDKGRSGVHVDPAAFSGILYLSRPQDCRGGTDFHRHRRTGLEKVPTDAGRILDAGYTNVNDLIADVVNRDTNRPAAWDKAFSAPMRYNRLILFSPWLFHNSAAGFGDSAETGRLVYLMFFERA